MRSGLNISVGDTKSIVLALQALQSKIRTLEQDRDYHHDQYDRALQTHEAYKLNVEQQAENERVAHHRREQELLDLLRQARTEKERLESAIGGSRNDLGAFRAELESMIASEKQVAEQRQAKLQSEIARLRQEVTDERARHAALTLAIEKLRAEKEATHRTNEELRSAMQEVVGMQQARRTALADKHISGRRGATRSSGPSRQSCRGGRTLRCSSRGSYRDPTCNSRLRDVHNVSGDVGCYCNPADSTCPLGTCPSSGGGQLTSARRQRTFSSHLQQGNGSVLRQRSAQVAEGRQRLSARRTSRQSDAVGRVEHQLQEELEDLQEEYKSTLERATTESLPPNVVTQALQRISSLIDSKIEQLKLMRAAHREVGEAPQVAHDRERQHVGLEKATQRTLLTNELRAMLTETANKV